MWGSLRFTCTMFPQIPLLHSSIYKPTSRLQSRFLKHKLLFMHQKYFWIKTIPKRRPSVCLHFGWGLVGSVGRASDFGSEGLGFDSWRLCCEFQPWGKIFYLYFLILPRCKWVPVLLEKFPAIDWSPVLGLVRTTCLPNVMEIGDWLRSYGPCGLKKTNCVFIDC